MGMKLRIFDKHDPDRQDGANPPKSEDDIEWDSDPHTTKQGGILKTFPYKGFKVVIIQGYGLWSVVDNPQLGRFTSYRDAFRAIDILEGAKKE